MPSGSQIASYALVSAVLIAIPGPSVLFAIGRALSGSRRNALAAVAGNAIGVYAVAVCVAMGLGAIVTRSERAFEAIKFAGAAYLVYLGVKAVRDRGELASAFAEPGLRGGIAISALDGFVVGLANPKALLLFGAILPQFVNRAAGHVSVQMILLALVSFATALLSDSAWVLAASALRKWFARSPRRMHLIGGVGGLAIIGVGVTVALTGRKD